MTDTISDLLEDFKKVADSKCKLCAIIYNVTFLINYQCEKCWITKLKEKWELNV